MPALAPIVVADDEEIDIALLRHAWTAAKIASPLIALNDGDEVINYFTGKPPYDDRGLYSFPAALLLLDLKMPRLTGFEVLDWLQTHPDFKTFPVVIFTSSDHEQERRKALELGASDFLVKPSGIHNLTRTLQELRARWQFA